MKTCIPDPLFMLTTPLRLLSPCGSTSNRPSSAASRAIAVARAHSSFAHAVLGFHRSTSNTNCI